MSGTAEMTAAFEEFQFRVALAVTQWESLYEKHHEFLAWIQKARESLVTACEEPGTIKAGGRNACFTVDTACGFEPCLRSANQLKWRCLSCA